MVSTLYPTLSTNALELDWYLKLLKATRKGKKTKQGFNVRPGNQTRNLQIIFDSNCAKEVKIERCLQRSTTAALVYY